MLNQTEKLDLVQIQGSELLELRGKRHQVHHTFPAIPEHQ